MAKLTPRQKRFVEEYLIDLNGKQAAIRAGYAPKDADVQGSRLLAHVKVGRAVDEAIAERSKRTGINQDRIIRELAKIAFSDMADFADWGPGGVEFRESGNLDRNDTACISEISEVEISNGDFTKTTTKLKLHDKKASLELLGKHLGMFKEKMEFPDGIVVRIIDDIRAEKKDGA